MHHDAERDDETASGPEQLLFLLLVLAQAIVHDGPLSTTLTVTSWVLWAVFVAEFTLRAWLARHHAREFYLGRRQRAGGGDHLGERPGGDVLHDEPQIPVGAQHVPHPDHTRMVQTGQAAHLAERALPQP